MINKKQKTKNITKNIFLIILVLTLSGCGLQGKSDGGVFKSVDGGHTFESKVKISEKETIASANILDLAMSPVDSNTLYVGTRAMGILRSTDGAETWVRDVNSFGEVYDIEISENNADLIFITASVGGIGKIMKTENGGKEWKEILTENKSGVRVTSLELSKDDSSIIYAGNSSGTIYKTEDGGESWRSLLWAKSGVKDIIADNVNFEKFYFVTNSTGVLRTDDGGEDFTEVIGTGGVYNLIAHPNKEGVIYLSDQKGLRLSRDNGMTWEEIRALNKPEEIGSKGFAVDPRNDNVLYFSSGKAFYKTVNGGKTWKPVQFSGSKTIEEILIDPSNTNVIYLGTNKTQESSFSLFPW